MLSGIQPFEKTEQKVKNCSDCTKDNNARNETGHPENLRRINYQISQSFSGSDKFSDNYAYKAETDIDLENA